MPGDVTRHDNDDKIPRPLDEIYDLNQAVAEKVERVFSNRGIPVIPTIGEKLLFVSRAAIAVYGYMHIRLELEQGTTTFGVGVFVLSWLAWASDNTLLPGPNDITRTYSSISVYPGAGHVPPTDGHYRSRCYGRYVELSLRFQATILGHLYGHLNTDHFYFLQADDLSADGEGTSGPAKGASSSLFDTLVADFSQLPDGKKEIDYGEYAVVNVNPSVVPNPYVPGFRVYAYNTTGLDDVFVREADTDEYRRGGNVLPRKESPRRHGNAGGTAAKCESPDRGGPGGCSVGAGWQPDVGGPSVRNSLWTPLGYAQYWMPRLKEFDGTHEPEYELEYLTFSLSRLHPGGEKGVAGQASDPQPPIPMANLPEALRDPKVKQSKYAPYGLDDLTIPSWLDLARRIGRGKEKKLRKRFRKYMYVGGDES
ncbi:hypothetical protein ID866_6786 [Astraeus odoratus]|nr:hypothetical protein ID866_6786 [Astraeus odoratus]